MDSLRLSTTAMAALAATARRHVRLAPCVALLTLLLSSSLVSCGRLPSGQPDIQLETRAERRQLQTANPWVGDLATIGASGLTLINGAVLAIASGDQSRSGAQVFEYIDWALARAGQASEKLLDLAEVAEHMTQKLNQIISVVADPLAQVLPQSLLDAFEAMRTGQLSMANNYLPLKNYVPDNNNGGSQLSPSDLKLVLEDGGAEKMFRSAASTLAAFGPAGIPAAILAMAQHLAVLQERFSLGDVAYRYVVRKHAAQYSQVLSLNGDLIQQFLTSVFNTARQNYPTSTYTLVLDNKAGNIYLTSVDGEDAVQVDVSRSKLAELLGADRWDLCKFATSNSTCGLVSDPAAYKYLVYSLSFMSTFGDAIRGLNTLRGFGNLDDVQDNCYGCTISLPDALQSSLARGKTAVMSSTSRGMSAALAVDGNDGSPSGVEISGTCAQTSATGTTDPYLRIDLETSQSIRSVHLFPRLDCCQEQINGAQVWVGSDGDKWSGSSNTKCSYLPRSFWAAAGVSSDVPFSNLCNGASGRYVWVHVPGPSRILTLCEVAVLGTLPVTATRSPPANSDNVPLSTCLSTASPAGQCGSQWNLCCPTSSPCCGSGGVCGNSTAACGTGCQALYSYGSLCQLTA